ncbi:hypothetical protein [Amycolatopsis sp. lyj-108]
MALRQLFVNRGGHCRYATGRWSRLVSGGTTRRRFLGRPDGPVS